jgi:hypothetical protein
LLRFLRAEFFHPLCGSRLELGVVLVFPTAGGFPERLFLPRNEESPPHGVSNEAAAVSPLDQAVEIGADFFGKRDVGAGCSHFQNAHL